MIEWNHTVQELPKKYADALVCLAMISPRPHAQRTLDESQDYDAALKLLRDDYHEVVRIACSSFLAAIAWETNDTEGVLREYFDREIHEILQSTRPGKVPSTLTADALAQCLLDVHDKLNRLSDVMERVEPLLGSIRRHHERMDAILKLLAPGASEWQAKGLSHALQNSASRQACSHIEESVDTLRIRRERLLESKRILTTIGDILTSSPAGEALETSYKAARKQAVTAPTKSSTSWKDRIPSKSKPNSTKRKSS